VLRRPSRSSFVVLVTIDAVRADRHYAGNPRELSQNLEAHRATVCSGGSSSRSPSSRSTSP
jgi:hypothetical protein